MIEPILSLAFSVHSNPGVYAILVGSGVSRGAGIPTGWEIVLDLARQMAELHNEDCGSDPARWYRKKYKKNPDYSEILDEICKTPTERNKLLRKYFEPNEQEKIAGLKAPTEAHKSIAELVELGFVKVIITTNFDKLLEKAIEDRGFNPYVLSTENSIKGAFPLVHSKCTILKVNGDYLDPHIRNSPEELEKYDPHTNKILDQIFDEFGLIVCGWSADWDKALCSALERCKNHRFTTYWTLKGEPREAAKKLIQLRRAEVIKIENADTFFNDLKDKVISLHHIDRAHPLSSKIASESLKRYLAEERFKSRVYDMVIGEANRLYELFSSDMYKLLIRIDMEELRKRVLNYEAETEVLQRMLIIGCKWGEEIHREIWPKCLERVTAFRLEPHSQRWEDLIFFPSLLLLYAGGLSAMYSRKYDNFSALFKSPKYIQSKPETLLISKLRSDLILEEGDAKDIFYKQGQTPFNDHLYELFRQPFKELIPDEKEYVRYFDRFEYIYGLIWSDFFKKEESEPFGPIGYFYKRNKNIPNEIEKEIEKDGNDWPFLKAGLFEGKLDRLKEVKSGFDNYLRSIGHFNGIRFYV